MRPLLVVGFGPFLEVLDNPAARLARACDGGRAGAHLVVGRDMPVTWFGAVERVVALQAQHDAALVLGVGVARGRELAWVERAGFRRVDGRTPDVDGVVLDDLDPLGPARRDATLDADALAQALGVGVSEDAGRYVCNAFLYLAPAALPVPVGFLHIPPAGFPPERLLAGLARLVGALGPDEPRAPTS